MSEVQHIKLSEMVVDKGYLMRDGIDKKTVAAYKENLDYIVKENPVIVFDTVNGFLLVDGFHRVSAARQLNWDAIPAIIRKGSPEDAFSHACVANLTHGKPLTPQERKKAICEYIKIHVRFSNTIIADMVGVHNTTIMRYRQELESKGEIKPQSKRLGSDNKIRETPNSAHAEVDKFDGWFDERVVCGDVFDVLSKDERTYDLIIVDPPYGITNESWDKQTKFDLLAFTRRWLNVVLQKLKPTGRLYVFWSREYMFDLKPLFDEIKSEYPLNFGGIIVWNYRNVLSMPSNQHLFKMCWEPIFYFYGVDAPTFDRPTTELSGEKWKGEEYSDVWIFPIPQSNFSDKRVHPTQKPLELYKRIIKTSTTPNDLILDPFAGSGTTGHAAYDLVRQFTLIEKNPDYVESIRNRLKTVFKNGNSLDKNL